MNRWLASFVILIFLSGCSLFSKSIYIDNIGDAYGKIRFAALNALPLGLGSTSVNGREVRSKYFFEKSNGEFGEAIQNATRYYAVIVINGERRPYDVVISVHKEIRRPSSLGSVPTYLKGGQDLRLAKVVKARFERELAKRREDLNIIDDFRVF